MAFNRSHVARVVCDIQTFGEIHQNQGVAEWVKDDGHSADWDVGRFGYNLPTRRHNDSNRLDDISNEPVWLIPKFGAQDNLGLAVGHGQGSLTDGIVAPAQTMPETIAVEPQTRVKIRDRNGHRINLLKQTPRHPPSLSGLTPHRLTHRVACKPESPPASHGVANAQDALADAETSRANHVLNALVGPIAAVSPVNTLVMTPLEGRNKLVLLLRVAPAVRQPLAKAAGEAPRSHSWVSFWRRNSKRGGHRNLRGPHGSMHTVDVDGLTGRHHRPRRGAHELRNSDPLAPQAGRRGDVTSRSSEAWLSVR